jgi:receptor expression-enhancing protein 5/6
MLVNQLLSGGAAPVFTGASADEVEKAESMLVPEPAAEEPEEKEPAEDAAAACLAASVDDAPAEAEAAAAPTESCSQEQAAEPETAPVSAVPPSSPADETTLTAVSDPPTADAAKASDTMERAMSSANDNMQIYKEAVIRLDAQLGEIPQVRMIADMLHIPPLAVAATAGFSLVAFCLWGFCGQLVSTFLGMLLPAYESFKCVEAFSNIADPTNSEVYSKASSMQFWLIYWIVVALFASFEYVLSWVLFRLPFYQPAKLVALLWLWLPQSRGANYMYHWAVAPIVRRNRRHIDAALEESHKHLKQTVGGAVTSMGVNGLALGAGGVAHLSRTVSNVVPELGGHIVRRLVPGSNSTTKMKSEKSVTESTSES